MQNFLAYSKKNDYLCSVFMTIVMRRTFFLLIFCICACAYALPAFSWGQEGHRIIAKIAYDNLNRKAKKNVDRILGKQGIIYWSNWPDEIKSDTIYAESIKDGWHYQDFNGGMSDSLVADALTHYPSEGGNLFRAMDSLTLFFILRNNEYSKPNDKSKDKDLVNTLRFIVHLSGDRYCPMHLAHMDDKGGNAVKMKWFGGNTNLHAVWDSKLIDSQGYSYTEYAQMLEHKYSYLRKGIEQMSPAELLIRNYHVTEEIYAYQTTWDGNAYHYIYRWHEPMELQLYAAGIRLAKLLNEIL